MSEAKQEYPLLYHAAKAMSSDFVYDWIRADGIADSKRIESSSVSDLESFLHELCHWYTLPSWARRGPVGGTEEVPGKVQIVSIRKAAEISQTEPPIGTSFTYMVGNAIHSLPVYKRHSNELYTLAVEMHLLKEVGILVGDGEKFLAYNEKSQNMPELAKKVRWRMKRPYIMKVTRRVKKIILGWKPLDVTGETNA